MEASQPRPHTCPKRSDAHAQSSGWRAQERGDSTRLRAEVPRGCTAEGQEAGQCLQASGIHADVLGAWGRSPRHVLNPLPFDGSQASRAAATSEGSRRAGQRPSQQGPSAEGHLEHLSTTLHAFLADTGPAGPERGSGAVLPAARDSRGFL